MTATHPDPVVGSGAPSTWSRARAAHVARRWWSLWNQGAPVAELTDVTTADLRPMRFAVLPATPIANDARTFVLFEFVDQVREVTWPSAHLVVVRSSDGLAVLPGDNGDLPTSTGDLARQAAAALGLPAAHDDHPPLVLPTALTGLLRGDGWRLRRVVATDGSPRWRVERDGERWWLSASERRVHFERAGQGPGAPDADVAVTLRDARDCSPELANRWCRWLDEGAGVRSRAAFAGATHLLHAELLEQYRVVYRATLVPDHPRKPPSGHHVYRIDRRAPHPAWGALERPDTLELVRALMEESVVAPEVVVEDDATPWRFDRDGTMTLSGAWDDDPALLLVRAPLGRDLPARGWLKPVDVGTSTLARRKLAFITEGTARRSIARLLDHPERSWDTPIPGPWPLATSGPLHLVQGPPGTGKTWTATEVVRWILGREPFARILVCAREHLALNHLAQQLRRRLADAPETLPPLLVRVLPDRKAGTVLVGVVADLQEVRAETLGRSLWRARRGEIPSTAWQWVEARRGGLDAPWVAESARAEASVVCCTTTDPWLVEQLGDADGAVFDWLIVEEAGKCYLSDLVAPMALARQWLLIGDHKQLPPYQLREVGENLRLIQRATPAQLQRGADTRSLLDARSLHPEVATDGAIDGWLQPFKHLFELAERRPGRAVTLRSQWRMERPLSDLVGATFYGAPFEHRKPRCDWARPAHRWLDGRHDLLWIDTPVGREVARFGDEPAEGRSLRNPGEAEVVANLLRTLSRQDLGRASIAVLTPYQGQKDLLRARLEGFVDPAMVFTTDEFQGKERDIIVLSLVRNNDRPTPRGRWGFVLDAPRLNVMFSRARQVMAVVGCATHVSQTGLADTEPLTAIVGGFRTRATCLSWRDVGGAR